MATRPTAQYVQLALLALDAYNRGKNAKIAYDKKDIESSKLASSIGTAKFEIDSDQIDGALASGFSASSYTLASGQKVISYRGTDFPDFSNPDQTIGFLRDVILGWVRSMGLAVPGEGSQPYFAQKFYEQITGKSLFPGAGRDASSPGDIIFTGHSLGGGLAGLVGSRSCTKTHAYDNMPYAAAANENIGNTPENAA
ncbi:MAG: hypothetical protein CFE31_18975 [Rhizobiales bacterium PAR1]|nr:MAG: hypothetical protein CFE31_18975 [Rhizobiales bacterium PAR1]